MPVSVVISFESADGLLVPQGQQLHGWLLNCVGRVDGSLADRLHDQDRVKPFSVMSIASTHASSRWAAARVTSLDEDFGRVLVNLDRRDLEHERLGGLHVRVASLSASALDHPLARAESYEALMAKAASRNVADTVALNFLTPTGFSAENREVTLFPHPHLVFRSLAGKWNRFGPEQFTLDSGLVDELGDSVRVEDYELRTQEARLGARSLKGFVGHCRFGRSRGARLDVWRVAHLLADFALYSGIGQKTTMGMGQSVRRKDRWV